MATTQQTPALFKPIKVGRLTLQHRIVLAPLTRFRAYTSHVPEPQQAYYSQRGSTPGTLLITEGTFISHDAGGYGNVPGIYTDEQIKDAVHAKESYIVGDDRVGVRISPWSTWQDMGMPDPIPTFAYLATALRCMAAGLQSQASSERKALVGRKHTHLI